MYYRAYLYRLREAAKSLGIPSDLDAPMLVAEVLRYLQDDCKANCLQWDEVVKLADNIKKAENPDQKPDFLYGKVVYFNPNKDKKFGFLSDDTFFHQISGVNLKCDGSNDPVEDGSENICPKKGDVLVYKRVIGRRGPKAEWWAFKSKYDQALLEIQNRPTYRLQRVLGNVVWEGNDMGKLRYLYPKKLHLEDPRFDMSMYQFLLKTPTGWVPCEDPR